MLANLIDLLMRPDAYVCIWRDGELFVETAPTPSAETKERTQQTSTEIGGPVAA